MNTLTCCHCPNFEKNKIVPAPYTRDHENLCLPCHNLIQFQWGEPYLCGSCCMTQLRMKDRTHCYSCYYIDNNKNIPKIDYKNQSVYSQLIDQLKNNIYMRNFHIVAKYYNFEDPQCEVYMSDIPRELIHYCEESRRSEKEIINFIEELNCESKEEEIECCE